MTIEERNTARAIQDIAKEMKKTPKIDWEQRRYEIAKDVLKMILDSPTHGLDITLQGLCKSAVTIADGLIEELKKGRE